MQFFSMLSCYPAAASSIDAARAGRIFDAFPWKIKIRVLPRIFSLWILFLAFLLEGVDINSDIHERNFNFLLIQLLARLLLPFKHIIEGIDLIRLCINRFQKTFHSSLHSLA